MNSICGIFIPFFRVLQTENSDLGELFKLVENARLYLTEFKDVRENAEASFNKIYEKWHATEN